MPVDLERRTDEPITSSAALLLIAGKNSRDAELPTSNFANST
jgi:hypothetical protein